MNALIIVDVQNDFLPGGSLAVPDADTIIPIINKISENFDLVVATQDWHPEGHSSFASQHQGKEPFEQIELNGNAQTLWPDHCVQGSHGAEFDKNLNLKPVEAIFRKGTNLEIDSYSGFYDNNHEKSTALADYLRAKQIDEVYICGLAADVCVYFTALDALQEDFTTYLITDATKGLDDQAIAADLDDIKKKGGKLVEAKELTE